MCECVILRCKYPEIYLDSLLTQPPTTNVSANIWYKSSNLYYLQSVEFKIENKILLQRGKVQL